MEGLFLASTAGISSRLAPCSGVLEEEDCVLQDLSFLHSALSRFLGQKQRKRQRESINRFLEPQFPIKNLSSWRVNRPPVFCGLYLLLQQKSLEALQATVHSLSSTSLHLRFETLEGRNEKIKINKSSTLSKVHHKPTTQKTKPVICYIIM